MPQLTPPSLNVFLNVFLASKNNLKNISCRLPLGKIAIITGPSGAGKSSLIFQTIYKEFKSSVNNWGALSFESQKRFEFHISGYRYSIGVSDSGLDDLENDLESYLNLKDPLEHVYARFADKKCFYCKADYLEESLDRIISKIGQCSSGKGSSRFDLLLKIKREECSLDWFLKSGVLRFRDEEDEYLKDEFSKDGSIYIFPIVERFEGSLSNDELEEIFTNFSHIDKKKFYVFSLDQKKIIDEFSFPGFCISCGQKPESGSAENTSNLFSHSLKELKDLSFSALLENLNTLPPEDSFLQNLIFELSKLVSLGLSHLSLNRTLASLSSGELIRTKIAKNTSRNLKKAAFFFENPLARLHPDDKLKLWNYFLSLNNQENSLFIIEQDEATVNAADFILELGPGSGKNGGEVVLEKAKKREEFLPAALPRTKSLKKKGEFISFKGLNKNNLKNINISFPLCSITAIAGVSGSGKSTALKDTIAPFLINYFKKNKDLDISDFSIRSVSGADLITAAVFVDSSKALLKPNSSVITVLSIFQEIKSYFLKTEISEIKGLKTKDFSFYKSTASCKACLGVGYIKDSYNEYQECYQCLGFRYDDSLNNILWRGFSIKEILRFSIEEAAEFFKFNSKLSKVLSGALKLKLGHLLLGQASFSLSYGEKTRLLFAKELLKGASPRNPKLFLLDEPAVGLSSLEIEGLLSYFKELCALGHSVFLIDHSPILLKNSDYLIELGPGAGEFGGEVVREGSVVR